jgi:hypothetical protein
LTPAPGSAESLSSDARRITGFASRRATEKKKEIPRGLSAGFQSGTGAAAKPVVTPRIDLCSSPASPVTVFQCWWCEEEISSAGLGCLASPALLALFELSCENKEIPRGLRRQRGSSNLPETVLITGLMCLVTLDFCGPFNDKGKRERGLAASDIDPLTGTEKVRCHPGEIGVHHRPVFLILHLVAVFFFSSFFFFF